MKIFKKMLSLAMVASMVLAMLTVAVSAAAPAAGTKYSVDLSLDKSESERFAFKAIRKADGQVFKTKTTKEASWHVDYPALWVDDGEEDKANTGYTVYVGENKNYQYDLMGGKLFNAVLAFKAPADGYYDVYFKGNKYQLASEGAYIDIALAKGGMTELYATRNEVCSNEGAVTVELSTKGIELKAGEEVWVVVSLSAINTRNGACNFGVAAFDVTYVGAEDPGTYVPQEGLTYKLDLNMGKATSSRYYVSAIRKSDKQVVKVDQVAKPTWSSDYPGFWVEGESSGGNYVIYKSEGAAGPNAIFDQTSGGDYMSVLAFKVPADGFYNINYTAKKYQDKAESVMDIAIVVKGQNEPLASKTAMAGVNEVAFNVKDVELKAGDEIWVVYTSNEANQIPGNSNLAVYSYDVTYVGTESSAPIVPKPGDVFKLNLSMKRATSKLFYISARSKATDTVATVEQTARASWSEDYPAFWIQGKSGNGNYVVYTTEKGDVPYFDMVCGGEYKSVLVFKAPADGIYNVYFKAKKYQDVADSITDITLVRASSSKALASKTAMSAVNDVEFDVKNVFLSAGEELSVIYTQNEANIEPGNSNLGINNFDVTYVGEGVRKIEIGDRFAFDLGVEKKANDYFKFAGILPDGTVDPLQDEIGIAWGDWKGWKLVGGTGKSLFCESQANRANTVGTHGLELGSAIMDMTPRPDGESAAIIFTAPTNGTYKFSGLFTKLKMWPKDEETGNVYKVEAIVNGEVVATYTFAKLTPEAKHEDALLNGHVVLKEGETIMFVASHVSGGTTDAEIAIRNIDITITSFGSTIPNPGTSDNLSAAVVLLVLATLGIAVVSKKRR